MIINDFKTLEKKVLQFVSEQEGFNNASPEKVSAFKEDELYYMVIYGDDLMAGIAGSGKTLEETYTDFTKQWKLLKGFEWLEKNRTA